MIKIGLTGGICTGKSFVLSLFHTMGAYTLKADQIAKTIIFDKDPYFLQQLLEKLEINYKFENQETQQQDIAKVLFNNPEKRLIINSLVHPKVIKERQKVISEIEKSKMYQLLIYESSLLLESGSYNDFDKILVVYCQSSKQLDRLMKRDGISKIEAEKKIKAQFPLTEKLKIAHYTIDTSGTLEQTTNMTLETFSLIKRDFNLPNNLIK